MSLNSSNASILDELRHITLTYNNADSQSSALRLILTIFPEWEHEDGQIEFIRFTDGITNTVCLTIPATGLFSLSGKGCTDCVYMQLLKAVKRRPGYTEEQIDQEAVLLRAYGKGTEVLIDRQSW